MPLPSLYVNPEDRIDSNEMAKQLAEEIKTFQAEQAQVGGGGGAAAVQVEVDAPEADKVDGEDASSSLQILDAIREATQTSSGSASIPVVDSSQTRASIATLSKEEVDVEVVGEGGAAPRGSIRPPPGLEQPPPLALSVELQLVVISARGGSREAAEDAIVSADKVCIGPWS